MLIAFLALVAMCLVASFLVSSIGEDVKKTYLRALRLILGFILACVVVACWNSFGSKGSSECEPSYDRNGQNGC